MQVRIPTDNGVFDFVFNHHLVVPLPAMAAFLDQYDPLDNIGNGSFGIIRKVRRKSDGMIFARKELNFERMSERDRKQIVAEVNILKDLHHEHIVGYHDRYVDRDAGILYILMEYCGGGDLSGVIKQSAKTNRPIAEDTIWGYFTQLLLALHHCHHPNGHGRSSSGSGTDNEGGSSRRPQILHRDLKPDNVFLDENNNVKLGDFGLSKALAQASFANTYVGTPYYMSPELMQEKAYDSKSDIWSLGCLIYELCALKPPFHEAKTHSELSILIRNGRIPPLPRGYSQALFSVIKAMLNLNPAMRPSAAQLLQHEKVEVTLRMSEAQKMLSTLTVHKNTIVSREREVNRREQLLARKETELSTALARKDNEIAHLHQVVAALQAQVASTSASAIDAAVKEAVAAREEELKELVTKREVEVAEAIKRRENEIMLAIQRREAEVTEAWISREQEIRKEVGVSIRAVEERVEWIRLKEIELDEREREVAEREKEVRERADKGTARRGGKPLEEVKNTMRGTSRRTDSTLVTPRPAPQSLIPRAALETPITRPSYTDTLPSAMKGVVLTATGETLATPNAAGDLSHLFNSSPSVGLDFGSIFEFRKASAKSGGSTEEEDENEMPPSPSARKEAERRERERQRRFGQRKRSTPAPEDEFDDDDQQSTGSGDSGQGGDTTVTMMAPLSPVPKSVLRVQAQGVDAPPTTRIRRPSIRTASGGNLNPTPSSSSSNTLAKPQKHRRGSSIPGVTVSASEGALPQQQQHHAGSSSSGSSSGSSGVGSSVVSAASSATSLSMMTHPPPQSAKPLPHPHISSNTTATGIQRSASVPAMVLQGQGQGEGRGRVSPRSMPVPEYDFTDQENLPSPFLKKVYSGPVPGPGPSTMSSTSASTTTSASSARRVAASDRESRAAEREARMAPSDRAAERDQDREVGSRSERVVKKRPSTGNMLRAVAAANAANSGKEHQQKTRRGSLVSSPLEEGSGGGRTRSVRRV